MVNIKVNLAHKKNYGDARSTDKIRYLVIHYTGNDGDTDENNGKYFANNVVEASAHYFVDDDSITQSVPDNYNAWAVGGRKYANCAKTGGGKFYGKCTNGNSLSIEICDDVKNGKVYPSEATIRNALALAKLLMRKYNIPASNVIRHFDVTGKICPAYWCGSAANNKKWQTEFKDKLGGTGDVYTLTEFVKDVQSVTGSKVDGIAGQETLGNTITISAILNRKHQLVGMIQRRLAVLGYQVGTLDGIAGGKFTAAVKAFQKDTDCVADGEVTARGRTWRKLLGMQ